MKKIPAGYYEIKPKKYSKRAILHKPNAMQPDNDLYSYTERYYNDANEECYEIHIHKPETFWGKIKAFFLSHY